MCFNKLCQIPPHHLQAQWRNGMGLAVGHLRALWRHGHPRHSAGPGASPPPLLLSDFIHLTLTLLGIAAGSNQILDNSIEKAPLIKVN